MAGPQHGTRAGAEFGAFCGEGHLAEVRKRKSQAWAGGQLLGPHLTSEERGGSPTGDAELLVLAPVLMLGEEHRSPLSGCRVRCLGTEGSTPEVVASSVSTAVGSGDSHTLDSTSSLKRIQNAKGHLDKG